MALHGPTWRETGFCQPTLPGQCSATGHDGRPQNFTRRGTYLGSVSEEFGRPGCPAGDLPPERPRGPGRPPASTETRLPGLTFPGQWTGLQARQGGPTLQAPSHESLERVCPIWRLHPPGELRSDRFPGGPWSPHLKLKCRDSNGRSAFHFLKFQEN